MRNKCVVVIFIILLSINIHGCISTPTYYVKPGTQELKTIRTLVVTVEGNPDFSHIGAITEESHAFIMLFAAPGAIIDTATRKDTDRKSAEAIKTKEIESKARQVFINTLVENLQQSRLFAEVKVVDNINGYNNFDAVLNIKINDWGTRVHQTGADVIVPFMDVSISMNLHHNNKLIWKETQTAINNTHHTFEDYKQQKGLFENDFNALVNKMGKQVAALLADFNSV